VPRESVGKSPSPMRSNKTETRQGHILRHQQRQKNYEDHEGETPDGFNYK